MCLVYQAGVLEFVEYSFTYHSSMSTFNHAERPHDGYMAVVDGPAINLTPLGKFVMPPPMFEKQVTGLPSVPSCVSLYGHQGVTFCEVGSQLCSFDCGAEKGTPPVYLTFEHGKDQRVASLLNFGSKAGEQMVLVQLSGALVDTLVLVRLELGAEPSLTRVAELELEGKIQRVALGAELHHSGHADPANESQNSFYLASGSGFGGSSAMPLSMMDRMNFGEFGSEPGTPTSSHGSQSAIDASYRTQNC